MTEWVGSETTTFAGMAFEWKVVNGIFPGDFGSRHHICSGHMQVLEIKEEV
jgi:hypothetical protein